MKELDDFTVERLQAFIDKPLDNGFTRDEQMTLARIALAAKTAEPVAWQLTHIDGRVIIERDKRIADLFEIFNGNVCMPLYAAPVLNSPELPDGWKLMPIAPTPEMEQAISDGIYNDLYTTGIYADLLAAAPTPPTTEKQDGEKA